MPVQMLLMKMRTCMLNTAGMATASSLRARAAAKGLCGPLPPAPSQTRALFTCNRKINLLKIHYGLSILQPA